MNTELRYVEQILRKVEELKSCGSQYIIERELTELLEKYKNEVIEDIRTDVRAGYCQFMSDGDCDIVEDDD